MYALAFKWVGGYENFTPLLGSHCPPNRIPISGDQIPGVIGGRAFARVGCGAVMGSGLGAACGAALYVGC